MPLVRHLRRGWRSDINCKNDNMWNQVLVPTCTNHKGSMHTNMLLRIQWVCFVLRQGNLLVVPPRRLNRWLGGMPYAYSLRCYHTLACIFFYCLCAWQSGSPRSVRRQRTRLTSYGVLVQSLVFPSIHRVRACLQQPLVFLYSSRHGGLFAPKNKKHTHTHS